jgi:phosphoenolpyruvate carboxylase
MPPILQKMASFDAQMRLLVPRKVSEDDKLIEYDALLLDRFLDILQDVNGPEIKETVSILTFTDQIYSGNILV